MFFSCTTSTNKDDDDDSDSLVQDGSNYTANALG